MTKDLNQRDEDTNDSAQEETVGQGLYPKDCYKDMPKEGTEGESLGEGKKMEQHSYRRCIQ